MNTDSHIGGKRLEQTKYLTVAHALLPTGQHFIADRKAFHQNCASDKWIVSQIMCFLEAITSLRWNFISIFTIIPLKSIHVISFYMTKPLCHR